RVVAAPPPASCRLVMRRKEGLPELVEFVVGGLEAGQQVFALGGPAYLKDIACNLGASGLRPDSLLRTGRLVFLTAPDCLSTSQIQEPLRARPAAAERIAGALGLRLVVGLFKWH